MDLIGDIDDKLPIEYALRQQEIPLLIYLLFYGASIPPKFNENILIPPEMSILISDYKENQLFKTSRFPNFPDFIQNRVESLITCIKIFSSRCNLKIPKPIVLLFIQHLIIAEIKTNISLKNKPKNIYL